MLTSGGARPPDEARLGPEDEADIETLLAVPKIEAPAAPPPPADAEAAGGAQDDIIDGLLLAGDDAELLAATAAHQLELAAAPAEKQKPEAAASASSAAGAAGGQRAAAPLPASNDGAADLAEADAASDVMPEPEMPSVPIVPIVAPESELDEGPPAAVLATGATTGVATLAPGALEDGGESEALLQLEPPLEPVPLLQAAASTSSASLVVPDMPVVPPLDMPTAPSDAKVVKSTSAKAATNQQAKGDGRPLRGPQALVGATNSGIGAGSDSLGFGNKSPAFASATGGALVMSGGKAVKTKGTASSSSLTSAPEGLSSAQSPASPPALRTAAGGDEKGAQGRRDAENTTGRQPASAAGHNSRPLVASGDKAAETAASRPPGIEEDGNGCFACGGRGCGMCRDTAQQELASGRVSQTALQTLRALGAGRRSIFSSCLGWYCTKVERHACKFIMIYISLVIIVVGVLWRPFELETDFSAFIKADGDAMRRREAYLLAYGEKKGLKDSRRLSAKESTPQVRHLPAEQWLRERPERRRWRLGSWASWVSSSSSSSSASKMYDEEEEVDGLEEIGEGDEEDGSEDEDDAAGGARKAQGRRLLTQLYLSRELEMYYAPRSGSILDERVMRDIRDFELQLRSLPGWRRLCTEERTHLPFGCDPGESMAAYAWPSRQLNQTVLGGSYARLTFDARGAEMLAMPATLAYMQDSGAEIMSFQRYLPKSFQVEHAEDVGGLRSKFFFRLRVGTGTMSGQDLGKAITSVTEEYEQLITEEIHPLLVKAKDVYQNVHIYYAGTFITSYEIMHTLFTDCLYALGSIGFVLAYMFFHTRSLLVSISCFFIIFMSIPIAYVLTPASKTTIASFLSLFLVTGIGCDVVFVFADFWRHSQTAHKPTVGARLKFMVLHAGKSCLATSLTTSVSFFANLASALQPLREFGLFMGLCVLSVFLLILMFLPPVLALNERCDQQKVVVSRSVDIASGEGGALDVVKKKKRACPCFAGVADSASRLSTGRQILFNLVGWLSSCPGLLACATAGLVCIFLAGSILGARLDQGVPQIFPEGHNQVDGPVLAATFAVSKAYDEDAPAWGDLCLPSSSGQSCVLHWCESQSAILRPESDLASCVRSPTTMSGVEVSSLEDCTAVEVSGQLMAKALPEEVLARQVLTAVVENVTEAQEAVSSFRYKWMKRMGIENWATGRVDIMEIADLGFMTAPLDINASGGVCSIRTLCAVGISPCELRGWTSGGQYNVTTLGLPAPARALQGGDILERSKQIDVTVLFGLRPAKFTPLVGPPKEQWSFDPTFEPDNPWAQRAMMALCDDIPADLLVVKAGCWIDIFRDFQQAKGKRFPSRDFHNDIADWWLHPDTVPATSAAPSLWIVDRKVVAARMYFWVNVNKHLPSPQVLSYMERWERYINQLNRQASLTADYAWYTAQDFVRAEAEEAIVGSTQDTIIISAACAFCSMLVFTQDLTLALVVLLIVIGIICGLAFFMIQVMGWAIGSIEVISLVVFVGYAVTYSLHIAYHYAHVRDDDAESLDHEAEARLRKHAQDSKTSKDLVEGELLPHPSALELTAAELRVARVRMAVLHLGGATLSSAFSTIGSSAFLLFCTLNVFVKLGSVVIAVTTLSIAFALIVLPAALMLCGPSRDAWHETPLGRRLVRLAHLLRDALQSRWQRLSGQQPARSDGTADGDLVALLPHHS
eukprot:TRINITY_DN25626_c0_g1_i1.p1 TRINITY_DN25626_c0_g1~~TRINITY_DN25626_c0_g1_i1.p1  ORF type:complete len:1694 (-),score=436.97 TRINITY_DN25626_c0_g1_i1:225-5306(-)